MSRKPTPATVEAGAVFAFETSPAFKHIAPGPTGRHAALKVLVMRDNDFLFAVLDGIWRHPPGLRDVEGCAVLRRHAFDGIGRPILHWMYTAMWDPDVLESCAPLGTIAPTAAELQLIEEFRKSPFQSHMMMDAVGDQPEREWRWAHDRDALLAEREASNGRNRAIAEAAAARYHSRLKGLTWSTLLAETPFENWAEREPPFPPMAFTLAARGAIHDACRELQALGAKPKKTEARKILKRCVEWFNAADTAHGDVIETEEREDIHAVLEEMMHVARHPALAEEIENWRTW